MSVLQRTQRPAPTVQAHHLVADKDLFTQRSNKTKLFIDTVCARED